MKRAIIVMVSLVAALLVAVPTAGAQELPEDCAGPPEIDLSPYNVIIRTNASEPLVGTGAPDFICPLLGDDVIYGLGGNDLILGDTTTFFGNVQAPGGDDTIFAGAGDDEGLSRPGRDTVNGGSRNDLLAL